MKKVLCVMLAILLFSALCGCESRQPDAPAPGTPLAGFYQAILAAQPEDAEELVFFEESDPAWIECFYPGLDRIPLNQQAYYVPPIATHPCEIVMVEVANQADVQAVADIFRARIELGADNTNYPESSAGWQLYAQVQTKGNFVCMIVLPGSCVIPENVFAA
jgi:hypothetical protein